MVFVITRVFVDPYFGLKVNKGVKKIPKQKTLIF